MMARPKHKPLFGRTSTKKSNSAGLEFEFSEDESWVTVKKQIVRILVPPLTPNKKLKFTNSDPSQSQDIPTKPASSALLLTNEETSFSNKKQVQPSSTQEPCLKIDTTNVMEKPLLAPKLDITTVRRSPRPIMTIRLPPKKDKQVQINRVKQHHRLELHSRPKARKHTFSFIGGGIFLNQKMRATILEKKLRRAGGLSRWLDSVGLSRFVTFFQRKHMGKFQLANLSMKKLKDMGAYAVGPRRKLIHAIDCLCEPSCFRAL